MSIKRWSQEYKSNSHSWTHLLLAPAFPYASTVEMLADAEHKPVAVALQKGNDWLNVKNNF